MITALIVDDEEPIVQVVSGMLQALGHTAITATDGEEAVDIYQELADKIDVVILDYLMPGMSGAETCKALRKVNPDVKILLASGVDSDLEDKDISLEGIQKFLQKPYLLEELSEAIQNSLDSDGPSENGLSEFQKKFNSKSK